MGQVIMMAEGIPAIDAGPPPAGLIEAVEESMLTDGLDGPDGEAEAGTVDESSMQDGGPAPADLVAEIDGQLDDEIEEESRVES